jgi:hypothetical protein
LVVLQKGRPPDFRRGIDAGVLDGADVAARLNPDDLLGLVRQGATADEPEEPDGEDGERVEERVRGDWGPVVRRAVSPS